MVKEHMDNLENLNYNSFQVQHWMEEHSLEVTPPIFRFKIIDKFEDPLSRKLAEALRIPGEGGLNKKTEFKINELCRLVSKRSELEMEKWAREEALKRKENSYRLCDFTNMIESVRAFAVRDCQPNLLNFSRKRFIK